MSQVMRTGLRESAEPVARLAEQLSLSNIRNMHLSPAWAETRVGVTRHAVYIVPKKRGVRTRGPDPRRRGALIKGGGLVPLMMGRSFEPALALGEPLVENAVNRLLGEVLH